MSTGSSIDELLGGLTLDERKTLEELQNKLQSAGAWTATERKAVLDELEKSRGVYAKLIEQAPADRKGLQKVRAELLTKFAKVYVSVYENLVKTEDGFDDFNAQALRCASKAPKDKPRQTTQQIEQLYGTGAVSALAPFKKLLDEAGAKLADADISVAPLKKMSRAIEKSMLRLDAARRGEVDDILDVVRGMVTCDSMTDLSAALKFFSEADHGWEIVRVKNRFAEPSSGGWADCLLNIVRSDDPNKHVCEVQLVHQYMLLLRKRLGGHDAYNRYRTADEILQVIGGDLLRTLQGHSSIVTSVAVFPDGRRVVSASYDNTLKVWDVATGKCLATLEGHSRCVECVAVSPDGRRVVSASRDKTLKVWDVATGKCVATLEGHSELVNSVAVFPDGRRVVSASYDNTLKVWDVATGKCVTTLEDSTLVYGVAVFPDGRRVVSGGHDDLLKVWDVATGKCVATLRGHSYAVNCVAVFPDGQRVVSCDGAIYKTPGVVKVWDVETGKCVATLEGHSNTVNSVAVFPDGRRVVSGSVDKTVKVWDVATGKCVATLEGHSDGVRGVAVFPDGRRVVSGSEDNTLKYWGLPK